jgi:hypothetical protein
MPTEIDRKKVQSLVQEGAQLVEVLLRKRSRERERWNERSGNQAQ